MKIYHYTRTDGRYTGSSFADKNPLSNSEWIIPAFATTDIPPDVPAGYIQVKTDAGWIVVENHVGEVWFDGNGVAHVIENTGTIPVELVTDTPPPTQNHKWINGSWEAPQINASDVRVKPWPLRQALNSLGLRQQVEDAIAGTADQNIKDAWEWASEFARAHPLVVGFGPTLGKTPEEIDQVFLMAYEIQRSMP